MNRWLTAALLLIVSGPLVAQPLLQLTPPQGAIDSVDYQLRTLVIDDTFYRLADQLVITDERGQTATIFALRKGRFIRATAVGTAGQRLINSIQLLAAPPEDEEGREADNQPEE